MFFFFVFFLQIYVTQTFTINVKFSSFQHCSLKEILPCFLSFIDQTMNALIT